ncbi:MAG TPA: hypothetical protein VFE58_10190 [Tepidisphaeraceae bacterium]|jgi:hypothetical protein|nr:hypothetical protein [Tepidisphaeraceae bacterium]
MALHLEAMESRVLFSSVTSAQLGADKAQIAQRAAAITAANTAMLANAKIDDLAITTQLKGSAGSTKTLLARLKSDESKSNSAVNRAIESLTGKASGEASTTVSAGTSLISKYTAAGQSKLASEIAVLQNACTEPLAALASTFSSQTVQNDLKSLGDTDSSNPVLARLIKARLKLGQSDQQSIQNAAHKLQGSVLNLAADLRKITAPAVPVLAATYSGTTRSTSGKHTGEVDGATLTITSKNARGTFTGRFDSDYPARGDQAAGIERYSVSGTIDTSGLVKMTFTDITPGDKGQQIQLHGQLKGKTLSGSGTAPGITAVFTLRAN